MCVCMYLCTRIYVCMYFYIIIVCVYVCMYVCKCVRTQSSSCAASHQPHTHYITSHHKQLPIKAAPHSAAVTLSAVSSHWLTAQFSTPFPATHIVPLPLITVPCHTVIAQLTAQCRKRRSLKTVTSLRARQFVVSIPVRIINLYLLRNVRSGSEAHAASIKGMRWTISAGVKQLET